MSDQILSNARTLRTAGAASGAAAIVEALPTARAFERAPMQMLALARAHLGRYDAALTLYERLAADEPSNPDILLQHGSCLLMVQRNMQAMAILSRLVCFALLRPDVYTRLGATL